MAEVWTEQIVFSRYHISVAERLLGFYAESPEKRFFVGALNEIARAASSLINAVLIMAQKDRKISLTKNAGRNLEKFGFVAGDYLEDPRVVLKIIKIKKDHKESPVHFDRGGKILFLIDGKYLALTVERLGELTKGLKEQVAEFKII